MNIKASKWVGGGVVGGWLVEGFMGLVVVGWVVVGFIGWVGVVVWVVVGCMVGWVVGGFMGWVHVLTQP